LDDNEKATPQPRLGLEEQGKADAGDEVGIVGAANGTATDNAKQLLVGEMGTMALVLGKALKVSTDCSQPGSSANNVTIEEELHLLPFERVCMRFLHGSTQGLQEFILYCPSYLFKWVGSMLILSVIVKCST
jgi:hypothetical protein